MYLSRTIMKKLKAMQTLHKPQDNYYLSGESFMLPERKEEALKILKQAELNHKNLKIIISGSFLYQKKYNDIDLFIISKYEKEDYKEDKLHFNYLKQEDENSLFVKSISQISISNFDASFLHVKERITISQIISKYQQVLKDITDKNNTWLKIDLRDLIMGCTYAGEKVVLNSAQLHHLVNKLTVNQNNLKSLFVYSLLNGFELKTVKLIGVKMIQSYQELMKEYKGEDYYNSLIESFAEVLKVAG